MVKVLIIYVNVWKFSTLIQNFVDAEEKLEGAI